MGFEVDISVLGEERISRRFLRVGKAAEDMSPAFRQAFGMIERQIADQFASKGGQSGGWAERKVEKPWPLMENTKDMLNSLTVSDDPAAVRDIGPQEAGFGSTNPYWVYHHSTGPRTSGLPRRPLLVTTEELRRNIMKAYQARIFADA